jgi:hypothetical protein
VEDQEKARAIVPDDRAKDSKEVIVMFIEADPIPPDILRSARTRPHTANN